MSILLWIGVIVLIIALILGFSAMRGIIGVSFRILKWVVIILVIAAVALMALGFLGWA